MWVKDLTGRTDITFDDFWAYASNKAMKGVTGDYRQHVSHGLQSLRSKIDAMCGVGRMSDDQSFKLAASGLSVMLDSVRGLINAKEGAQSISTEMIPQLLKGAMG